MSVDEAKQVELEQRNSDIAEVMGGEWTAGVAFRFLTRPVQSNSCKIWQRHELQYHSSWEWLMPVWERVCELTMYFDNFGFKSNDNAIRWNSCAIYLPDVSAGYDSKYQCYNADKFKVQYSKETLIESVWLAISDFAKWYISPEQVEERAKQKD